MAHKKTKTHQATGALPMARGLLSAGIELDAETEREREARLEVLKSELLKMATRGDVAALIDKTRGSSSSGTKTIMPSKSSANFDANHVS